MYYSLNMVANSLLKSVMISSIQGGVAKELSLDSQSISHISAINVGCKNHGLLYLYLTVDVISFQAIPVLFTPIIVTSAHCVEFVYLFILDMYFLS